MSKLYKITKYFRGGSDTYYIRLRDNEKLTEDILESIGEHTSGGHESGYQIYSKKIKKLPKGEKVMKRHFETTVCIY